MNAVAAEDGSTFLNDQDWSANIVVPSRWDSLELLQRIYDSICVDSTFSADTKPAPQRTPPCPQSCSVMNSVGSNCSVESCVAKLRSAAAEDDWPTAFSATIDFLTIARSSPSARRARLVLGSTRMNSCFTFDDFALFCASLFTHWPRVEVPSQCLLECGDCESDVSTLSCEGQSVRAICRALQSLRVCFGGDLSLQERHVIKKLSFVTCGAALAHSAAIEGLFPIFFESFSTKSATISGSSSSSFQARQFDLSKSLASSGFLQGLAEIFILTLARHQQWYYLLLILAHCSETGKSLFSPIVDKIPVGSGSSGKPIACRIHGLRVPSIAVISLLHSLCVDQCNLGPCCDNSSSTSNSQTLKDDLILSLLTLLICRTYSDEMLINRVWHQHMLSSIGTKDSGSSIIEPSHVLQKLKVFLTKTCCQSSISSSQPEFDEEKIIKCALDTILMSYVFKDDKNLHHSYQKIFQDHSNKIINNTNGNGSDGGTIGTISTIGTNGTNGINGPHGTPGTPGPQGVSTSSSTCCSNDMNSSGSKNDVFLSHKIFGSLSSSSCSSNVNSNTPLRLPLPLTSDERCQSLRLLWGKLKDGESTMKKYYTILELCSRICETFMLTNHSIRYPSEFCEDRENGMSCSVATETLNSLTGCKLTNAEIWLMKIIETYEAEYGMPSDLPGLSGPRKVFTHALNLSTFTIQCLIEPVVKCTLPPSLHIHKKKKNNTNPNTHPNPNHPNPNTNHPNPNHNHHACCNLPSMLPKHITLLLPGCFFKKVNALTSANKDHRWYLGWRALGLEILAIGRCSNHNNNHKKNYTRIIAPHLATKRLVKSFIHLYTQSANPRSIHLLHRLKKSGLSLCDPLSCVSADMFGCHQLQQTVKSAFDPENIDDDNDETEDEDHNQSLSLKILLQRSLESKFVLMADAAAQMTKHKGNTFFFEESERSQIIDLILQVYLESGHAQDARDYLNDIADILPKDIIHSWSDRIALAIENPQSSETYSPMDIETSTPLDASSSSNSSAPPGIIASSTASSSSLPGGLQTPSEATTTTTSQANTKKWKKALSAVGDDPEQAIQLFYQLRDSPEGIPDVSAANRIIHACVSGGELAKAEELFHVLRADAHSRESAVRPDVVTGNIILKALAKWKPPRVDDMERIVREMESDFDLGGDGVVADQVTFNTFINAAVTAGSFSKAWEYFGVMKRRKIPIDGFTCSILMKQIGPSTRPELISEILLLLAELDPCEDPVLLSSMVDVYSRLRDYSRLKTALTRYERRVPKPIPYAMATLVKGWGRCGDVHKAAMLWDRLEATPNLQLTQYLCSCGVDAFVTNGDLERGLAIYRKAQAGHIIVSDVQSSHLIRVCTQRRRLDDALRIYRDMRANQLQPCDVTYNNLMHLCVLADDLETAVEILNDMSTNAKHQPDVVTYSTIIKGLCDRGAMKLAMQLFEEIPSRGVNPDIVAYNTLLEGFARADQLPQVESLFSRLLNNGVKPTCYTLTILIRFYGRRRCLDQVFNFIENLPKLYDIKIDAYVYTATIAACTWNGRVDKAFEFLTSMRQNFDASARTYGTLVAGCIKSQTWNVLSQVLKAAIEDSIVLGKRDISSLNELCQQGINKTVSSRWIRAGFDEGSVNELKFFLNWHAKRG